MSAVGESCRTSTLRGDPSMRLLIGSVLRRLFGAPTAIDPPQLFHPESSLVRHVSPQPPCQLEESRTRQLLTLPINDDDCHHPTPGSIFLRRNLSEHIP